MAKLKLKLMRFFSLSFWIEVLKTVTETSKRFPLAVASLFILSLLTFSAIHDIYLLSSKYYGQLIAVFAGGLLWFSSGTLFCENRLWFGFKKHLFLTSIFLLYCWKIYLEPEVTLEIITLLGAALVSLSFFPRLFRKNDNASSWYFNFKILSAIAFAALAAVIFSGGLSLILISIGYLFEVKIKIQLYGDAWVVGSLIFAPLYVLAQLPRKFDFEKLDCQFPKGVYFILNFVMVPLTLVYMIILYAYFIKILLQWELPQGNLGWMISIFGVIGILTHLAVYPVKDSNKSLMAWFYRNFYRIMIVPVILLIIAIGVRVEQYGITNNRYFALLCCLWFVSLITSNIIRRKQFKLITVTVSLSVLLFLASFGPWGIKQLPITSQFNQFTKILIKYDRLKDGKIQLPKPVLDAKIRQSLSSIADYILRNNRVDIFRKLFTDTAQFNKSLSCFPDKPCNSRNATKLLQLMGIKYQRSRYYNSRQTSVTVNKNGYRNQLTMFPVSGYDYVIPINYLYPTQTRNLVIWDEPPLLQQLKLELNKKGVLSISSEKIETIQFDLIKFIKQFPSQVRTEIMPDERDKMQLTVSNNSLKITLFVIDINMNEDNFIGNISGNLFIKIEDERLISGKLETINSKIEKKTP